MERFFLNLKMERVWQRDYANHGEAQVDIADYIVGFYNATRLHSTLGYRSPAQYEHHHGEGIDGQLCIVDAAGGRDECRIGAANPEG